MCNFVFYKQRWQVTHLRQQCHNSKCVIFQERLLKVLKCYNILWVQRWHNCSSVVSFVNCVMTLYLLKVHLQTFLSIPYLLTPWCRVLLEKLTGLQVVKKFPAFDGTRRFITTLTSVHHLSLSWASPTQSIYPHPTSWRSILILSTHLRLGLPSGLLPSGFPAKTLYNPLSSPIRATCPIHLILLDFITRTVLCEEYKS